MSKLWENIFDICVSKSIPLIFEEKLSTICMMIKSRQRKSVIVLIMTSVKSCFKFM